MGLAILILVILVVGGAIAVVGWLSGWWLTAKTDIHGEPGSQRSRGQRERPIHNEVEDEAKQRIVGGPDEPR
jgi:hypothetical protein